MESATVPLSICLPPSRPADLRWPVQVCTSRILLSFFHRSILHSCLFCHPWRKIKNVDLIGGGVVMWSGWQGINGDCPALAYIRITTAVAYHVQQAWVDARKGKKNRGRQNTTLTLSVLFLLAYMSLIFGSNQIKTMKIQIYSHIKTFGLCSRAVGNEVQHCGPGISMNIGWIWHKCLKNILHIL